MGEEEGCEISAAGFTGVDSGAGAKDGAEARVE